MHAAEMSCVNGVRGFIENGHRFASPEERVKRKIVQTSSLQTLTSNVLLCKKVFRAKWIPLLHGYRQTVAKLVVKKAESCKCSIWESFIDEFNSFRFFKQYHR
jgi:hypothetical protein